MSYEVYVVYSNDESKAVGYEFGTDECYYTIEGLEDLHEAICQAEKEMARAENGVEIRRAYVANEQNDLTVWHSSDPPELKIYNSYSYEEWNTIQQGHHAKSDKPSVYFDIDGTLGKWYADGRGLPYEEIINPQNHYFRDIEPHPMMVLLAEQLHDEGFDVCVISAADKNTIHDKWEWIDTHLPFIPKENICFSPIGADKSEFVKGNAEISILIDDYNKNLEAWKGTAIKAINTVNSHQDKYAEIDFTSEEALIVAHPEFFVTDVWFRDIINDSLTAAVNEIRDAVETMQIKLRLEKESFAMQIKLRKESFGEHSDNIYVNEEADSMTWVYYNPDSSAGGQLVYNEFSFDDLRKALKTPDPIDYIQSTCRQSCIDVDSLGFIGYAQDFLEPYGKECSYGEIYCQCAGESVLANLEAALYGIEEDRERAAPAAEGYGVTLFIYGKDAESISEIKDLALGTGASISSNNNMITVSTWESHADEIKNFALSRDATVSEHGVHQVIANYGVDGGIDEKYDYRSFAEAINAAQEEMNGGAIGAGVYNLETKKIEHTIGDFNVHEIFSDDILKANGTDTAEGKPKSKNTHCQQGMEL